jgi:hypothetical protein
MGGGYAEPIVNVAITLAGLAFVSILVTREECCEEGRTAAFRNFRRRRWRSVSWGMRSGRQRSSSHAAAGCRGGPWYR